MHSHVKTKQTHNAHAQNKHTHSSILAVKTSPTENTCTYMYIYVSVVQHKTEMQGTFHLAVLFQLWAC